MGGFKIGGSLGKIANNVKKMDAGDLAMGVATGGTSLAYKAATGNSMLDDGVSAGAKLFGIQGKGGVAEQYMQKQASEKAAKYQAANDPNKGFSKFMDTSNEYTQRFGTDRRGTEAKLADYTDKAYAPLQDQTQNFIDQAPVTANVDPAFRQYQMGLAQQLQAQANGQGPSLAQMQLQQATDQSLNQSMGQIRAATGQNGALAARTAALAGSQQLGGLGLQSGMLRLQEQRQAQQALGDLSAQGRSGDLAGSSLQAQTALASRGQQLDALGQMRSVIGDRTSGATQVMQGSLGLDTASIEAKRLADQKATDRRHKQQDGVVAAGINGLVTAFSS